MKNTNKASKDSKEKELSSEEKAVLRDWGNTEGLSLDTKKWLAEGLIRGKKSGITAFIIGGVPPSKRKK